MCFGWEPWPETLPAWCIRKGSHPRRCLARFPSSVLSKVCVFLSVSLGHVPSKKSLVPGPLHRLLPGGRAGCARLGKEYRSSLKPPLLLQSPLFLPLPLPPLPPPGGSQAASQVKAHEWAWREGCWRCAVCLRSSRASHPPSGHCPGGSKVVAQLAVNSRGHAVQTSPFSDGSGAVIICSKCGHLCTSARTSSLTTNTCKGKFASAGASSAWSRVTRFMHPKSTKGDAKVLESPIPLSHLLLVRQRALDEPHASSASQAL